MLLPRVTRLPVCWGHKTLWHDQLTLGHQNRSRESSVALSWLLYASAQNRILFLWPQPLTWSSHKAPITAMRCQEQRAFWGCTSPFFSASGQAIYLGGPGRGKKRYRVSQMGVHLGDEGKVNVPVHRTSIWWEQIPCTPAPWTHGPWVGLLGWSMTFNMISQNFNAYISDSGKKKMLQLP